MKKTIEKVVPKVKFRNMYVVQNFGVFKDCFYYKKEAEEFVAKSENGQDYQIYKCDVYFENIIQLK